MKGRKFAAWVMLALFTVTLLGSVGRLVLWAQEGALQQAEQLEERQRKVAKVSGARRPASAPAPTAGPGVSGPGDKSHRWGNMNWFALYLALAGPTTYFVFRGAAR